MMLDIINQTICMMCHEIKMKMFSVQSWHTMQEDDLLYEAAICIFGSQMVFEVAIAAADRLRERKLLRPVLYDGTAGLLERKIACALSDPLHISSGDGMRAVRPRFKNRLAALLAATIYEIYGQSLTIHGILLSAKNAKEARCTLTQHVWGFGPKQASLFLRRIGYCTDLAVLDVHVLDYLRLSHGLALSSNKLGRLSCYEQIEDTFREIAEGFGHSVGCVDLATWVTMRVAKREAFL